MSSYTTVGVSVPRYCTAPAAVVKSCELTVRWIAFYTTPRGSNSPSHATSLLGIHPATHRHVPISRIERRVEPLPPRVGVLQHVLKRHLHCIALRRACSLHEIESVGVAYLLQSRVEHDEIVLRWYISTHAVSLRQTQTRRRTRRTVAVATTVCRIPISARGSTVSEHVFLIHGARNPCRVRNRTSCAQLLRTLVLTCFDSPLEDVFFEQTIALVVREKLRLVHIISDQRRVQQASSLALGIAAPQAERTSRRRAAEKVTGGSGSVWRGKRV